MVVSYSDGSQVFTIGEAKVTECPNSGFDLKNTTLHCGVLEDGSHL